jgi:hypothetical protein
LDNESRICVNDDCKTEFKPRVYNAIYCCTACRRTVTNAKILRKYHENKAARGKKRRCDTKGCNTMLSQYNKENICESCKRERYIMRLVGWGWDEKEIRKEMSL